MVDLPEPYLPDILEAVSGRVDAYFSQREDDPFNVYFNAGLYSQVGREIYKRETGEVNPGTYPLIWLLFNWDEKRGKRLDLHSQATCSVIIAVPTQNNYTQDERDIISFKSRLNPIAQQFIKEISREKRLQNSLLGKIHYDSIKRPYWGGADNANADTKNLFKNFIDAIEIKDLQLNIKRAKTQCIY